MSVEFGRSGKNRPYPQVIGAIFFRQKGLFHRLGGNTNNFILAKAGADISGEYMMNPADSGTPRKVAIICHGHTVNRYSDLKYADIFYRAGFSTVIFDERYFGESTGDFCTLGQNEARDVAAIIAYVRQIFGQDCVIGLHGESRGAATALLTLK